MQLQDLMFSVGLTPSLTEALKHIAEHVPEMLSQIQGNRVCFEYEDVVYRNVWSDRGV